MSESTAQADSLAGLTGREYALARRAMLSKAGKKGAAMLTPQSVAASRRTARHQQDNAVAALAPLLH